MDPFGLQRVVDPFGGLGFPGDPMEQVLSLQTMDSLAADDPQPVQVCAVTAVCRVCSPTQTCTTNNCTFSCAAAVGAATGTEISGW